MTVIEYPLQRTQTKPKIENSFTENCEIKLQPTSAKEKQLYQLRSIPLLQNYQLTVCNP